MISSRSTQATFGSSRSAAIVASMFVVSATLKRAATTAGEISAWLSACCFDSVVTASLIRADACRATSIERYALDAALAKPSASLLNPTTIRSGEKRRFRAPEGDSVAPRAGERENVAKGVPPAAATVPVIIAPLLATNDTDTPTICVLVTVTT